MSYKIIQHSVFRRRLRKLRKRHPRDAAKIDAYIRLLSILGLDILATDKAKTIKVENHLLYYLRPYPNRIIFCAQNGDEFVMLHIFEKKRGGSIKSEEINIAKKRLIDWQHNNKGNQ